MKPIRKTILTIFLALMTVFTLSAQETDKEKATKKLREAITLMDGGEIERSLELLKEAKQLDPGNFVYDYESGFAYQLKKDYKNAIKHFEASTKYANADAQSYQMLGNVYDIDGNSKKAIEVYTEGLKKFPNSGKLYVEMGVMALIEKEYEKAAALWEKGISVDPKYPSNYYRLANLYAASTDRIWGMFYAELYQNIDRTSARTKEMSAALYGMYDRSITFSSDTSARVDFAKPMTIDASSFDPNKKFKLPFDQVFGLDFLVGMSFQMLATKPKKDLAFLHSARSNFIDRWYSEMRNKDYPNILLDYQKEIKDSGHFEAYNYWLFREGNAEEFKAWFAANEEKFKAFAAWYNENPLLLDTTHYFTRKSMQ